MWQGFGTPLSAAFGINSSGLETYLLTPIFGKYRLRPAESAPPLAAIFGFTSKLRLLSQWQLRPHSKIPIGFDLLGYNL